MDRDRVQDPLEGPSPQISQTSGGSSVIFWKTSKTCPFGHLYS